MSNYEHTIIARQDTSASQIKQIKEKYSEIIHKNKGNIIQTQDWGLMNLSYLIKKNKKGSYIHFKFKGKGNVISELEKNEAIDKKLLRYLTVRVKKFDLETNFFSKKDEFEKKMGWGHSSWQEGVRLCQTANVKSLAIFHHDPEHEDIFMRKVEKEARSTWDGAFVARDNMMIKLL